VICASAAAPTRKSRLESKGLSIPASV
jgi:hypothetical protein